MYPTRIIFDITAGVALLIYWGVAFVIFYHLARFGIGVQPKKLAAIFLFGSVILSVAAIILFTKIDINAFLSP